MILIDTEKPIVVAGFEVTSTDNNKGIMSDNFSNDVFTGIIAN